MLDLLTTEVSKDEILAIFKSLPLNKAPGPDGYTVEFYRAAYKVVAYQVITAIQEFFTTGRLLKKINATANILVPKCPHPSKVTDFRPISCCNTIYKLISKILADRLNKYMPCIISVSQSAFIKRRRIIDNILLAQEIVKDYSHSLGRPRCSLKIDVRKVFDSINWSFVISVMDSIGFPTTFLTWIRECITIQMFSIKVNGHLEGFFKGRKGLRQGDPLAPYLFVICMEVLTQLLHRASAAREFKYHPKCDKLKLSHLCFAVDLMLLLKPLFLLCKA